METFEKATRMRDLCAVAMCYVPRETDPRESDYRPGSKGQYNAHVVETLRAAKARLEEFAEEDKKDYEQKVAQNRESRAESVRQAVIFHGGVVAAMEYYEAPGHACKFYAHRINRTWETTKEFLWVYFEPTREDYRIAMSSCPRSVDKKERKLQIRECDCRINHCPDCGRLIRCEMLYCGDCEPLHTLGDYSVDINYCRLSAEERQERHGRREAGLPLCGCA